MKIGLVLEGGAMKGMYTVGVLDTFMDHDIHFDGVIGVSAGALFGVNIISGQKGRAIRYNKKYNKDPNYMGIKPLLKTGNIIDTDYAFVQVPRILDPFDDEAYKKSLVPFYAVVTNIETGQAEYIQLKSIFEEMETLRASGAMPYLSQPVKVQDKLYLDGAVADSIPFEKMLELGYDKLVVVLTKCDGYVKKPMPKVLSKLFYKRKYPKFAEAIDNRHNMYNEQMRRLKALEKEGKVLIIQPSREEKIGRVEKDPEVIQNMYNLGVEDATRYIDLLKKGL